VFVVVVSTSDDRRTCVTRE